MRGTPRLNFDQITPDGIDATEANTCWEWMETVLKPLRFTVVSVRLRYSKAEWEKAGPGFDQRIGFELAAENHGHLDSIKENPYELFFYLHSEALDKGLEALHNKIGALGLLPLCNIAFADVKDKSWRVYHLPA